MIVSADQIREHIVRHLQWDNSLKGSRIKVDYVGRIAVLTGTVPNLSAHTTAQRDTLSIPGVDSVENRLTVEYPADHPNKTDEEVKSSIRSVLGCTVDTGGNIQVSVVDGIVELTGKTDSYWRKNRIEDLASSVDGVLDIKNQIRVALSNNTADDAIKKEIVTALERMEVEGLENLQVSVKNGVVALSGSVPTWDISFDVEDTARYTGGVTDVKNNLQVE